MSEIDWDSPESAERYDQNCDHQFQKSQALVEMMKLKKGDSVLDIGCGTGRQAVNVSKIIGLSGQLTGIDPSSHRIELARKKFGGDFESVRFLVGQAEDLSSIPDNSINHVYFCSSFHWIDDKKTALHETFRVLRPGGRVGMTTLDRDSPSMMRALVDLILAKYNVSRRSNEIYRGVNRVNALELHSLLSEAGFTCISIEPRTIPRQYRSPEEFLRHLEERDSSEGLLKDIPAEIGKKIKQEIIEELVKIRIPTFVGFGIATLFAIATKPNE